MERYKETIQVEYIYNLSTTAMWAIMIVYLKY